jgi:hypothetical protein
MPITGEINISKCGNGVRINVSAGMVDINIGPSVWLIMTREQADALKNELTLIEKILKEDEQ